MAQAIARIRFSDIVETADVDEALRLIDVSKSSLMTDDSRQDRGRDRTFLTSIYNTVNEIRMSQGDDPISINALKERVFARGYNETQLNETINVYCELNVWQRAGNGTRLVVVRQ